MCKCKFCKKSFNDKKKSNATVCRSCSVSRRRWISKISLVKKLGGKCTKCGFTGHPSALHFHHKDPNNKKFSINSNKLLVSDRHEEIKKCILLCANCHSIEHANNKLLKSFGLLDEEWLD